MYMYIYIYIHTYLYIYIYIYAHIHTHTYIYAAAPDDHDGPSRPLRTAGADVPAHVPGALRARARAGGRALVLKTKAYKL